MVADDLPRVLPGILSDVEEIAGRDAALALVRKLGGLRIYVAAQPNNDSLIASVIGLEAAEELGRRYGGDRVVIPNLGKIAARSRGAEILAMRGAGASVTQIARAFGLTERHVYRLLAPQVEDQQSKLF